MAVTLGTATFSRLTAQPFGYEGSDIRSGLSARRWLITGLLTPSEWLTLLTNYDNWRNLRIDDTPTEVSLAVGTTINLTATGPGGQSWTSVPCWFSSAPEASQQGAYLNVSVELVDANQALAVLVRSAERDVELEDLPNFGTVTVGTTTLTLLRPMESYGQGPQLQLTASGVHYLSGPLVVEHIRDIEGTTNAAGWAAILSWYESQIVATPAAGTWYPISIPTVQASNRISDGVKSVLYTVSLQLGQVIA